MCWIGKIEDKKIAQEDIKCKKVLEACNDHYYAYYHEYFEYELGKVYETEIKPEIIRLDKWETCRIQEGLHCYNYNIKPKRLCGGTMEIQNEFGRTTCYPTCAIDFKVVLVECTIPKGAEYWENESGVIVSSKLIVEEEIYIKDDCNFCK